MEPGSAPEGHSVEKSFFPIVFGRVCGKRLGKSGLLCASQLAFSHLRTIRHIMSNVQSNLVERFVDVVRASTSTQVGIASAIALGGATAAWMFAPYIKLGASAAKGELLSVIYGTPEQRLLDHVKKNAKKNDPQSVLDTIDDYCWKNQWMMNVGNIKGQILDKAVKDANPKVRSARFLRQVHQGRRIGQLPRDRVLIRSFSPYFRTIVLSRVKHLLTTADSLDFG